MATRIQVRRGTTSEWNSADPILNAGEFGYNTTLDKFKIGDGSNIWSDLEYVPTSADLSTSLGDYIGLSEKGSADGVAELDATGNVPLSQLGNLIDSAPEALDTLNELAAALGDDSNFATTVTNSLAGKISLSTIDAAGDLLIGTADNTVGRLAIGTNGYLLTSNGTTATWEAAPISLPSQTGESGKYLTTDGTTASWGTVSSYSAPTLGSTSIASGATVTTIAGLTLSSPTITGSLTAGGGTGTAGQVLVSTGTGVQWTTPAAGAAFSEFMLIGA